jgi:hypothetical protein
MGFGGCQKRNVFVAFRKKWKKIYGNRFFRRRESGAKQPIISQNPKTAPGRPSRLSGKGG